MFPGAHQLQFNLILNIFNVQRSAGRHAALEGGYHLCGEVCHRFVDPATRGRSAPLDGQKRLGNRYCNFAVFERNYRAIAFNDAELSGCRRGQAGRIGVFSGRSRRGCDILLFY